MSRRAFFQQCNADSAHQRMAGLASWAAFSARWRARQGLPLLYPMQVQYLTPQDFCNGMGYPLLPTEQRRLFREYVEAAVRVQQRCPPAAGTSGDLAFVRSGRFVRSLQLRQDVVYGRQDIGPYAPEALSPARPYGVPVTSEGFEGYWLDGDGMDDENW